MFGTERVAAHFDKIAPRGEIVVVVGGKNNKEPKKVNFLRKNNHEKRKSYFNWSWTLDSIALFFKRN
jgi:16S rRNA C1402 (ribose-2'-O) methylase RsmI